MVSSIVRRASVALASALVVHLVVASAEADVVLDRASVAAYARKQSPIAKAALAKVPVAQAGTVGVGVVSLTNPTLTAMGGLGFGPRSPEVNATLAVPVDLAGRPKARLDAAVAGVDLAKAEAGDSLRGIVREALLRWARALRGERAIVLARARRDVAATLVAIAKRRAAAGEIAKGDASVFEVELGREDARLVAAEGAATARRVVLVTYVGAPTDAQVAGELVWTTPPPPLSELLASIDQRPDVVAATAALGAAGSQVGLAKADAWPTVSVVGSWEYHESRNIVTMGLSLPLPLFNANKTAISTADAKVKAAEAELHAVRTTAVGELKAAWATWSAARAAHEALAKVASVADLAVARAVKAYDVGTIGVTDVLLVRRTAQDAATELLDAELALAEARIELDAAAGRLP